MVKRHLENELTAKEIDPDFSDEMSWEVDSKDTVMHIEMSD